MNPRKNLASSRGLLLNLLSGLLLGSAATPSALARNAPPCAGITELNPALECIQRNEPAFLSATHGEEEASALESSAYRLINPEFNLEHVNGTSVGESQRETTASLLFTLELGGKRSARAKAFRSEGLALKADAFEQRISTLTELGGSALRLRQILREKAVLSESLDTFKKIIRLYRSRSQLPPEQRVSLHTFELITIDYERRILENEAEEIQVRNRTRKIFGEDAKGVELDVGLLSESIGKASRSIDAWIDSTPEMLRIRAKRETSDAAWAVARAEMWPDLKIGPAYRRVTAGPISYSAAGISVSFPIPVLTWNQSLRTSRETTARRVEAQAEWDATDVRSRYEATLSQIDRVANLLRSTQSEAQIQAKHRTTESYFERGLVSGVLIIEAHRSLVDYTLTKHALERKLLEDVLKIRALTSQTEGKNR